MLVAPFAAVVVLAALWTVLWFQAARTAEATVSAWMVREARAGRVYDCAERTTGGYPFRIEQRCSGVRIELRVFDPPLELTARELVAVAQVYQPTLIIAEARGPASVTESGRTVAMANWRLAQASLRGRPAAPERVSLVLDRPELAGAGGATAGALVKADHFEFHVRRDPTGKGKNTGFDFAVRLTGATWPASQYLAQPVDAELVALLQGLDSLAPRRLKAKLRELQAAGAKLEVTEARLRQGAAVAAAKGELTLSETGHLNGMLTVTMAGFEGFVQQLAEGSDKSKSQAGMLAGLGLALLGRPAEIDGKQAVALPLRFGDNGAFLGPLLLGRLPPLY
jgi:hypothetical protein